MLLKSFYVLLGFIVAAFLCEAGLQLFPVATGYRFQAVNAQEPVLRGEPGYSSTYSFGWNFRLNQQHRLNNYGYISTLDYRPASQPVLVIGDSFVQAAALNEQSHFAARLSKALGISVYPLYESGADLADYLAIFDWGIKEFQPKAVLILISEKDVLEAKTPEAGSYHFQCSAVGCLHQRIDKPTQGIVNRVLNSSKLFRYLFDNLKVIPNLRKSVQKKPADTVDIERDKYDKMLVDLFLAEVDHSIGKQNVLFLIKPEYSNPIQPESHLFKESALAQAFQVIDLQDVFLDRRNQGVRLDFMPLDAHWNETAHQLTAQAVQPALSKMLAEIGMAKK
jgi:hypothetical protein